MPTLTRWYIKTALAYFVVALLAGLALAVRSVAALPPLFNTLAPVYFHLLMVGWVTQLIFGVVYWMFPKYSADKPRGSENLSWATYWLLNVGLILRAIGEPLVGLQPEAGTAGWVLAVSAASQWLAGLGFVANTWGRVKEK
ncbi:MAG TPA: cbb3-type cytochrome c oxidase subunit I [Anaerolineales bacterium]|nr:cbb3-type cytochrome c oxidase subunit I [Anaerolineales bacterium]